MVDIEEYSRVKSIVPCQVKTKAMCGSDEAECYFVQALCCQGHYHERRRLYLTEVSG